MTLINNGILDSTGEQLNYGHCHLNYLNYLSPVLFLYQIAPEQSHEVQSRGHAGDEDQRREHSAL